MGNETNFYFEKNICKKNAIFSAKVIFKIRKTIKCIFYREQITNWYGETKLKPVMLEKVWYHSRQKCVIFMTAYHIKKWQFLLNLFTIFYRILSISHKANSLVIIHYKIIYIVGCWKTLTLSQYEPGVHWFLENSKN